MSKHEAKAQVELDKYFNRVLKDDEFRGCRKSYYVICVTERANGIGMLSAMIDTSLDEDKNFNDREMLTEVPMRHVAIIKAGRRMNDVMVGSIEAIAQARQAATTMIDAGEEDMLDILMGLVDATRELKD